MADSPLVECPECQARCGADENVCWVCRAPLWERSEARRPTLPPPRMKPLAADSAPAPAPAVEPLKPVKPLKPVPDEDLAYTPLPKPQQTVSSDLGLADGAHVAAGIVVLVTAALHATGADGAAIALLLFSLLIAGSAALQRHTPAKSRADKVIDVVAGAVAGAVGLAAIGAIAVIYAMFSTCVHMWGH